MIWRRIKAFFQKQHYVPANVTVAREGSSLHPSSRAALQLPEPSRTAANPIVKLRAATWGGREERLSNLFHNKCKWSGPAARTAGWHLRKSRLASRKQGERDEHSGLCSLWTRRTLGEQLSFSNRWALSRNKCCPSSLRLGSPQLRPRELLKYLLLSACDVEGKWKK